MGKVTDWMLTTASITTLTREGINKTSMKPGEILKVTILPARNGNPAGFIRNLQLGDREHPALLRRRARLTEYPGSWQWLIDELSRQVCSLFLSR